MQVLQKPFYYKNLFSFNVQEWQETFLTDFRKYFVFVERNGVERHESGSVSSLESNGSLPSVTNHRCISEHRVALWAVSFERLLLDPVGVRYFSVSIRRTYCSVHLPQILCPE